MVHSIVPPNNPPRPNLSSKSNFISRSKQVNIPWKFIAICSTQARFMPVLSVRAEPEQASITPVDPEKENEDENKVTKSNKNSGSGLPISIPNIPPWARWFLGSILLFALPFYKNFINIEDKIEKTAKTVLDVVEEVAEVAEEVAEDVAKALPENSKLKKVALAAEHIADEIDKDAEKIETFVEKVDDVVDEVDAMVGPIIEGKIKFDGKAAKSTGPDTQ